MSTDQEQERTDSNEETLFITKKRPVLYSYFTFIFLMGILVIILGSVLPELTTSSVIVFAVIGSLITIGGLIGIFGVPLIAGVEEEGGKEDES